MKLDIIKKDTEKRLAILEDFSTKLDNYPGIKAVLAMDNQACWELFGIGNSTLTDVEELFSMLFNALYDDSNIAFKKNRDGFYILTWAQDHPNAIYEEELLDIVSSINTAYDYYTDNTDAINARVMHPTMAMRTLTNEYREWNRLRGESEKVLLKYGWDYSDIHKESQDRIKEMRKRLGKEEEE